MNAVHLVAKLVICTSKHSLCHLGESQGNQGAGAPVEVDNQLGGFLLAQQLFLSALHAGRISMSSHTIGVIPPPPGIVPNFNNPESIASYLILPSVLGAAIAIPVCSIRLYTKRSILKLVSYDDCKPSMLPLFCRRRLMAFSVDAIVVATV